MNKRFKPQDGQPFFMVDCDLTIGNFNFDEMDPFHVALSEFGNVFKTEEEAAFAAEQIRVRIDLQRLADAANEAEFTVTGDDPTVWDTINSHYYIYWDCENECLDVLFEWDQRADLIYFPSAESAHDAIKQLGAERIARYLFDVDPAQSEDKDGGADA